MMNPSTFSQRFPRHHSHVPTTARIAWGLVGVVAVVAATLIGIISGPRGFAQEPNDPNEFRISRASDLPSGRVGIGYEFVFFAEGGDAPYAQWAVIAGRLPNGLAFDAEAHKIVGIPRETGEFRFTLRVTDAKNREAVKIFTVRIVGDPFELSEKPAPTFDGDVHPETEYAGTAAHIIRMPDGQDARVFVRQSGGVLHFGFIVPELYVAENAVRIAITDENLQRIDGFLFNPFNPARPSAHDQQFLARRPSGNHLGPANWITGTRRGFLGKANAIHAGSWHAEVRIDLEAVRVQAGTPGQTVLIAFAIIGADGRHTYSPPMVPQNERNPRADFGFFAQASYFRLRSTDNFGTRRPELVPTAAEIDAADRQTELFHRTFIGAKQSLHRADQALEELRVRLAAYLQAEGENAEQAVLEQMRRDFDRLRERRQRALDDYQQKILAIVTTREGRQYFAQLNELASYFAKLAENPAPWDQPRVAELWQRALHNAEITWRINPSFVPARKLIGRANYRLGLLDEALRHFNLLAREFPHDPQIVLQTAQLHLELSDRDAALADEARREAVELQSLVPRLAEDMHAARQTGNRDAIIAAQEAKEKVEQEAAMAATRASDHETAAFGHRRAALAHLDDLAVQYHATGHVPLTCAALLFSRRETDDAEKYVALAHAAAMHPEHTELAVKLIEFFSDFDDLPRMVATARQLTDAHGHNAGFCIGMANLFRARNMHEQVLDYVRRTRALLARNNPEPTGPMRAFIVEMEFAYVAALANLGRYQDAANVYRELLRLPIQTLSARNRQEMRAWADIEHYPEYYRDELAMRERDAKAEGTPRANPQLRLTFSHPTDPAAAGTGTVVIELFRQDAPELVNHVLGAIRGGFYATDFAVEDVSPAFRVVLGVGGQTMESPRARVSHVRRHFRGSVALVPLTLGEVGLPMAIATGTNPMLNSAHPVVGRVIAGQEIIDRVRSGYRVHVEIVE